eukprot:TRINITY_DN10743_c0_g1_i1.p1 TRINITY_DN10743_c0_g1~~TRINITY_DN10743_c0_g1_i1.p1  ORF type:complete len:164 (-),score=33.45 TRINITY_DN10743_c0_g1_i1:67-537(-)
MSENPPFNLSGNFVQNVSHSTYLRGDPAGYPNLTSTPLDWEVWQMQFILGTICYIKNAQWGTYLSSTSSTTVALIPEPSTFTNNEKWQLIGVQGEDSWAFYNIATQTYLRGDSNTTVNLTTVRGAWERWLITDSVQSNNKSLTLNKKTFENKKSNL